MEVRASTLALGILAGVVVGIVILFTLGPPVMRWIQARIWRFKIKRISKKLNKNAKLATEQLGDYKIQELVSQTDTYVGIRLKSEKHPHYDKLLRLYRQLEGELDSYWCNAINVRLYGGQAMVEFALVLVFFIMLLLAMVDVAPLVGDLYIAKQMSARGARAASVYYPDGSNTCYWDVIQAIGNVPLASATYDIEILGDCNDDPYNLHPGGEPVTVRINVTYTPMFMGGIGWPARTEMRTWPFSVETTDITR